MANAKKVEVFRGKYSDTVVYLYRGKTYEVEYAKDWSYCCSPAWVQHRDGQARIDDELDHPKPAVEARCTVWEALDDFMAYLEGDEH